MPPTEWSPILNIGAVGLVLLWFMLKAEPRLKGIEDAIDRNSKALMLFLLAMEQVTAGVKAQATLMLEELEAAARRQEKN